MTGLIYSIAVILFIVGLVGLLIPGVPGAELIRWSILLAILLFVIGLFTGRA